MILRSMVCWFVGLVQQLVLLNLLSNAATGVAAVDSSDAVLIIVSYDAFRVEYLQRNSTRFMNDLRRNGTTADFMRNVFPTKTFPNHHSIATGVYPIVHGVMANGLYDHGRGKLEYSYELFHFNEEIVPIWTLNELSGGHSGCMMWPGSDFGYTKNNVSCSHVQPFNLTSPWNERVDTVFRWIRDPQRPANLVMLYIEEPDYYGHIYSPESDRVAQLIVKLNDLTRYIHDKIREIGLQERVNVLHMSDHGMDSLMAKNFINLTGFVPPDMKYDVYGTTPVLQLVPKVKQQTADLYRALKNASERDGNFDVYTLENLPARWHFNNSQRTGPITAVAKLGYGFDDMWQTAEYYRKRFNVSITPETKYGVHGYDNELPIMHPIFFGYGPRIQERKVVEPFDTVDLYYLFCEILGLSAPYFLEGRREHILEVLRNDSRDDDDDTDGGTTRAATLAIIFTGSLVASFALVSLLSCFVIRQRRRRENQVPPYLYDETESLVDEGNKLLPSHQQPQQHHHHQHYHPHHHHRHHLHTNITSASINGDVVSIDV
ncbi:bis(5'-adenosyl)-triphosphatase enpp4-like [Toxorhynchites rutilus septentrionalis]|uniref:bis(5'-adenosyl)-triphosphatase enpp4-like n=1 Tax=Toxorhynchites rutilus septentrionalis TaxID=329112 RepID=UPI002478E10F|nr:bis(5'-adenosyl)-triphosphatase enpp4-like [Toxorhynchites rutilus septentrionalis]